MPGLDPGIQVFRDSGKKDGMAGTSPAMTRRRSAIHDRYSITACSGASDCLRNAALVEPIMIPSGIAHSVKIITSW